MLYDSIIFLNAAWFIALKAFFEIDVYFLSHGKAGLAYAKVAAMHVIMHIDKCTPNAQNILHNLILRPTLPACLYCQGQYALYLREDLCGCAKVRSIASAPHSTA